MTTKIKSKSLKVSSKTEDFPPEIRNQLPETAKPFEEILGLQMTLKLARHARFRAVYIPKHIHPRHKLCKIIGEEKARELCRNMGGLLMPLAKCRRVYVTIRNAKIIAEFKKGSRPKEIAKRHNIAHRSVLNTISQARADGILPKGKPGRKKGTSQKKRRGAR